MDPWQGHVWIDQCSIPQEQAQRNTTEEEGAINGAVHTVSKVL